MKAPQNSAFKKRSQTEKKVKIKAEEDEVNEKFPYTSKKQPFNPENYRFKRGSEDGVTDTEQEKFKQQFYNYKDANKARINQQLVESTYLQVIHRFEKEKKVSAEQIRNFGPYFVIYDIERYFPY